MFKFFFVILQRNWNKTAEEKTNLWINTSFLHWTWTER